MNSNPDYMQFYARRLTQAQVDKMGFSIFSPIQSIKNSAGNLATIVFNKIMYVFKWVAGAYILFHVMKFGWKKFREHQTQKSVDQQFQALALQVQGA